MSNLVNKPQELALPAHLQGFTQSNTNVQGGDSVPSLSFRGKAFSIVRGGEAVKLVKSDPEQGVEVSISVLQVVVLAQPASLGRIFYKAEYSPGANAAPECFSVDGIRPDGSAREPQAVTCKSCPHSVKGSAYKNGQPTTKCALQHRLMLAPLAQLDQEPLLARLPITSYYDPKTKGDAWQSWQEYNKSLAANGVPHTGLAVTEMRFDAKVDYPKVLFRFSRWISEDEMPRVKELIQAPEVLKWVTPQDAQQPQQATKPIVQPALKASSASGLDDALNGSPWSDE